MSQPRSPENISLSSDPLLTLLDLSHRAREAASREELVFLLVNDSRALLPYRQAVLWLDGERVRGLSGVVEPDRNAPYVQWLERVCAWLMRNAGEGHATGPRKLLPDQLPADLAAEWAEWLPAHALWIPVDRQRDTASVATGGLLLAGDTELPEASHGILQEWMHAWFHAWEGLERRGRWWRRPAPLPTSNAARRRWWQRRPVQGGVLAAAVLLIPVRMSVLAPAELVAADALVVRAPLDGVVDRVEVQPNQAVKAGEVLFTFEQAPIASRLEVARQALSTAEAEYRQSAQLALFDSKAKGQLALLQGKISERQAEAGFLEDQFQRAQVVAARDGVVIFDDASEWQGRPVRTGERVMKIVEPGLVEMEAWLPVGDAIPLPQDAEMRLYLASTPLDPVIGRVRYVAHEAVLRPEGHFAYRVRASLSAQSRHRIGLQGTGRLLGEWVPLGFWMLRRPLATIRQFLGL